MKKVLVISFFITTLLFSCKENSPLSPQDNLVKNDSKQDIASHYGKITDNDINNLHDKVSTFSNILMKMYSNDNVINEVNEFIKVGFYSD